MVRSAVLWSGLLLLLALVAPGVQCWGSSDPGKVLLKDVQVLTLKHGKMTTGHRTSPVPQLKCVGGSAANAFTPQVVQCYNRGWDGVDVQWECKSDMDNLYRFGNVEVFCEGYSYPDDPYITKGSCGLEFTLEYTKEGQERQQRNTHDYYGGSSYSSNSYDYYGNSKKSSSGGFGDLILFSVVCVVGYALYKTCCTGHGQEMGDNQYSSTSGDYPGGSPGGGGWFNQHNQDHQGRGNNYYGGGGADCGAGARQRGTGAGNFWTGMGVGGLMGYMFGNRGNYGNYGYGGYNHGGYYARPRYGGGSSFFSGGGGGGSMFSGGGSGGSSGTRTASGFGGTRRR